jgi:ABC-2 type transport system ATP-binding protein
MKRKLSLARTLLPDPPVLLLDEATAGLDVISSRNLRDFIRKTVEETGKTVLYTTHYIEEAAQICTKIGILKQGQIIACDTPNAIRDKIKKDELIYLILEEITPAQIEKMRTIQRVIGVNEKTDQDLMPNQKGLRVQLQNVDQLRLIFDFLFEQKIKFINFKREEPSLEDAFIELTKKV